MNQPCAKCGRATELVPREWDEGERQFGWDASREKVSKRMVEDMEMLTSIPITEDQAARAVEWMAKNGYSEIEQDEGRGK